MSTLWTYGCSWTYSREHVEAFDLKFWPEIVGEDLNIDVINHASGGTSIFDATQALMKDLSLFKRDDIIVFEFTYSGRYVIGYFNEDRYNKWHFGHKKLGKFYTEKSVETWANFVMEFNGEILMKEFLNILPIFDYIENVIGAKVKYWLLNMPCRHDQRRENKIVEQLWNPNRSVLFESSHSTNRQLYLDDIIFSRELTYKDDYRKGITKHMQAKNDSHPNQKGQELIAKYVKESINGILPEDIVPIEEQIIKRRLI